MRELDSTPIYYTYRYFDPSRNEYFYVGKGVRNRAFCHLKAALKPSKLIFYRRLKKMLEAGISPVIDFICKDVDEEFALFVETEAIAKYGRINTGTGTLTNLTDGGEGTSGKILTPEHIAKLRAACNTPEARARMSASLKGHVGSFKGKKQHPGHMEKMLAASKAKGYAHTQTPEYREKISKALTGKKRSDEAKENYSRAAKLREAKKREARG